MSSSWAESALMWWSEAGVDTLVDEAPRDWLNPKAKAPGAPPEPAGEALPATLDEFQAWLAATDRMPFASPSAPRISPSGDPASGLMMLTDMPSADDIVAGTLLSGEVGQLFDRMLAAIGRSRETIYLAAFSPIRPPAGRIDSECIRALADIARHHAGLAAPGALLLFGDACSRALVGAPMTEARGRWHEVATPGGPIRALVTIRPQELVRQPALKAHAWADLKLLMEELKP